MSNRTTLGERPIEKLIRVTMLLRGDSTMRLRAQARAELTALDRELQRYRSLAEDLALWEPGTSAHSAALDALIGMATRG